jgi:hypothetical protein
MLLRYKAPTKDFGQGQSFSHFLRLLFQLLEEHQIRYCVPYSLQSVPEELPSDQDCQRRR